MGKSLLTTLLLALALAGCGGGVSDTLEELQQPEETVTEEAQRQNLPDENTTVSETTAENTPQDANESAEPEEEVITASDENVVTSGTLQVFGIWLGSQLDQSYLQGVVTGNLYEIDPPTPLGISGTYYALIDDTQTRNTAKLAFFASVHDDGYGFQCQNEYEDLQTALVNKYGDGTSLSFVPYDSYYKQGDNYVYGIYNGKRATVHFWDKDGYDILLKIEASSVDRCFVKLVYEDEALLTQMQEENDAQTEGAI